MRLHLIFVFIGVGALTACGEATNQKNVETSEKTSETPIDNSSSNDSIEVIIKDSKTGEEKHQMVPKDVITNPSTIKQPEQPIIEK